MYDLIKNNQRKSWLVFIGMGLLLISLGGILGYVFMPYDYQGVITGFLLPLLFGSYKLSLHF